MAHQLAGARGLAARDLDLALAHRRQNDLHLVAAVRFFGPHLHRGEVRIPFDQLPILPRAVAAARAAQVQRLQQVRLALAVVAQQHVHPRTGREFAGGVVAKVIQFCAGDAHGIAPLCVRRARGFAHAAVFLMPVRSSCAPRASCGPRCPESSCACEWTWG